MKCPKCSKDFVIPIRYGMPGSEMQKDYYEGKIKLGGCLMAENSPNYHCNDCKYEWQRGKRNEGHYEEDEDGPI
jgi:hypothetical protein